MLTDLFLAVLGLHCCAWSRCDEGFIDVCGLLTAVASRHGAGALGTQSAVCGTWAWLLRSLRHRPGPGGGPTSSALTGGFLSTAPSGKSHDLM